MTRQTLDNYINKIAEVEKDIYGLVYELTSNIENIQKQIMITGFATAHPAEATAITLLIEWRQDDVVDAVDKAVNGNSENGDPGLKQFIEGMRLPTTLLDKAVVWREIKQDVNDALSLCRVARVGTEWEGNGATNYENHRFRDQEPAFTGMYNYCETAAAELEKMAKSVVTFYGDLHTQVFKLVNTIKNFVTDISSASILKAFFSLITDICESIVQILKFIVSALCDTEITVNHLNDITVATLGLAPGNKWPSPETGTFSDFSYTDGDNKTYQWDAI